MPRRDLVPVIALGALALRAIAAMLIPAVRTPGFPDVVVAVVGVACAAFLLATGPVGRLRLVVAAAVALFFLAPVLVVPFHAGQSVSIPAVAMAAVAVALILGPPDSSAALRAGVLIGGLVVIASLLYGFAGLVGDWSGPFHSIGNYQRAVAGVPALRGIALHPNTLGQIAAVTVIVGMAVALARRTAGSWVIPALAAVCLIWTQSRAGLASTAVAVIVLLLLRRWTRLRPWILGAGIVLSFLPPAAMYVLGPVLPLERWLNGRQLAWLPARDAIADSGPLGYGPDFFSSEFWRALPDQSWQPMHAHNEWLEIMGQAGLLGLTAGLGLVLILAIIVLDRPRTAAALAASLGVLVLIQSGVEVPMGLTYFPVGYLAPALVVAALSFAGELERPVTPADAAPGSPGLPGATPSGVPDI